MPVYEFGGGGGLKRGRGYFASGVKILLGPFSGGRGCASSFFVGRAFRIDLMGEDGILGTGKKISFPGEVKKP